MYDCAWVSKARAWRHDRRKARRYKLNWPARIRCVDTGAICFDEVSTLIDLSSRSAFAYLAHDPVVGSKLSISIRLPVKKEAWMSYSGTVVRVVVNPSGESGVAIKFDRSRPEFAKLSI